MAKRKQEPKAMTATERITAKYPKDMIHAVRQNLGLDDPEDTSRDDDIDRMSRAEFLDCCLTWHGLIGYGDMIREWVGGAYNIEILDDDVILTQAAPVDEP